MATTHSGSTTQEIFYVYVDHLIASLPKDHAPVILLLDGHGSRWSVPALRKLMDNKIYPFFIASHTSIWAQPNDAGVNKRFHWAMEQAAKTARRSQTGTPNAEYFNMIFCEGWALFLETERKDLRELGFNNTTNAYERTGMFPFNPFASAWMDAIETLGTGVEKNEEFRVQYEPFVKKDHQELSPLEKEKLREGQTRTDPLDNHDLGDGAIAIVRGEEILKLWRMEIEKAVSEGEEYQSYAKIHLPKTVVMPERCKVALKLIDFQLVDITTVEASTNLSKDEKRRELTKSIISSSKVADPIKLSYLAKNADDME